MEVALTGSHGIAKQAIISIRAGSVRRQAALSALDKPFRFPCTPEECGSLKVDLLTLVGTARVICHPGDHDYSLQLEQPVTIDGSAAGKQEVSLKIRRAAGEAGGRQEDDRAKRKQQALHASEGYLEKHKILPLLQGILQSLLKEQPEDPYRFVASQFGRDAEGSKEDDAKLKAQEALLVALDADADEEGSPVDDAKLKAQEALLVALDADADAASPEDDAKHKGQQGPLVALDAHDDEAADQAKEKAQRALVAALDADEEEEAKEKAQRALVAALDACEEEEAKEKAQHALVAALDADEEEEAKEKAQHGLVAASDADEEEEANVKAQHALLAVLEADEEEEAKEKAQHALVAALDADEEEEAKEKAQHALLAALDADEEEEAKEKAQHALVAALEEHEEEEAKEKAQHALVAALDADEEEDAEEKRALIAALDADETMAIGPSASWSSSMPGDESVELKHHAVSVLERAVETGALHEILHQYAQQSELRGTLLQVRDGLLEAAQTGKLLRLLCSMPHGQQQAEVKETSEPMLRQPTERLLCSMPHGQQQAEVKETSEPMLLQPTERILCSSSVGPAATQTSYVQPTPKAYMVASGNNNAGCAHPRLSGAREAQQELAALAQGKAELTAEVMKIQAMIEAATLKKQQVTRHAAASTRLA